VDLCKFDLMTNGPMVMCLYVRQDFLHYASGRYATHFKTK
jgi:hypothetical protein